MEQHPIPQNVSSYQFKLVGDMTLKQFFELAGGVLVGLLFYSTPLPGLVKWPFIILSVILGAAMAFVPLEERPLEQWILAFFKTIYSPTIFNWKKTTTPIKFFLDEEPSTGIQKVENGQDAVVKDYLDSTKPSQGPLAKLENAELKFLSTITGIFGTNKNLSPQNSKIDSAQSVPIADPATQEQKKIQIPVNSPVKIVRQELPHIVVEEKKQNVSATPQILLQKVAPIVAGNEIVSTKDAIFSIDAAPPSLPTTPNVITGQVVDEGKKIIEGAIIEVRDEFGRPIRALRSNKLGHFVAVTPLENGKYSIVSEKEGYQFMPVNFVTSGQIIPPILVIGKRLVMNPAGGVLSQGQTLHTN